MTRQNPRFYEFGPFLLDTRERLLVRRDGERVALRAKVFETLLALLENSGRALSKDEVMERLWPDVFVEEGSLAQNVSRLRKALCGEAGGDDFIETLPGRGYRFVAEVRELEGDDSALVVRRRTRARVITTEETEDDAPDESHAALSGATADRQRLSGEVDLTGLLESRPNNLAGHLTPLIGRSAAASTSRVIRGTTRRRASSARRGWRRRRLPSISASSPSSARLPGCWRSCAASTSVRARSFRRASRSAGSCRTSGWSSPPSPRWRSWRDEGRYAEARRLSEESLEHFRRGGHREAESVILCNVGAAAFYGGDFEDARRCYDEAVRIARELGYKVSYALALDGLAALASERGEMRRAALIAGAAVALRESINFELEPADREFRERYLAGTRAAPGGPLFDATLEEGAALTLEQSLADSAP